MGAVIELLVLTGCIAFLLGGALGILAGRSQGKRYGLRLAPILLRRDSLLAGRCGICGGTPRTAPCTSVDSLYWDMLSLSGSDLSESDFQTGPTTNAMEGPTRLRNVGAWSKLDFAKLHGLGNDYVYFDLVSRPVPEPAAGWSQLARAVSDRHFGVGSDGIILIAPSDEADFKMIMFNSDGSRGLMCGNGIRGLARYVVENGLTSKTTITVETDAGIKTLDVAIEDGNQYFITVDMGEPGLRMKDVPVAGFAGDEEVHPINISLGPDEEYTIHPVSMGNPHAVIFVNDVDGAPVTEAGPVLEKHPLFPERANIEFVEVIDSGTLRMRVWERGSGETMACGTGACASLVAASLAGLSNRKGAVRLPGGELRIEWKATGRVMMQGPAEMVFRGTLTESWLKSRGL